MATFSQRHGYTKLPEQMMPESMTDELRNSLWNLFDSRYRPQDCGEITRLIWRYFYKKPVSDRPHRVGPASVSYLNAWDAVKGDFLGSEWYRVYDYVEFFISADPRFGRDVNSILKEECAAYRVINGQVCQITDQNEIVELENSMTYQDKFAPISVHIQQALKHLSNRENPDYRNSIKESISAVEAAAQIVTGDPNAELGKALAILERKGKIDGALKSAFSAIYGWTSNQHGIRHAMTETPTIGQAEAKFFLIACSAFANYLKTAAT